MQQIQLLGASGAFPKETNLLRNVVAIGGSAGALDSMLAIAGGFPVDFQGYIFIVSHIGANQSHLADLLTKAGALPAVHPQDGEPIQQGTIYVAPPDLHLLVEYKKIRLSRGPRQHFTRPAIDPLFQSVAREYGPRAIGVVLSGIGSDGAFGLEQMALAGGMTVVQDPNDTLYSGMPRNAASAIAVDHVVPAAELPGLLLRLASEPVAIAAPAKTKKLSTPMDDFERPIALTCPECGGALREIGTGAVKQYGCHIGHRFSPDEVLTGQISEVDRAIEVAVRILHERLELCRNMGADAGRHGRTYGVRHWRRLQEEAEDQLAVLLGFLARRPASIETASIDNSK